jgi:hypothetical protein
MAWDDHFLTLFGRCVAAYRGGNSDFASHYGAADHALLASIGCKPRELFDFVEDHVDEGEPSAATALLVAAVRRDFFAVVQNRVPSQRVVTADDIPTFGDALEGIHYLPRLLAKARAKLRGELDPDVMFCCGGDRKFLRDHGDIHPADFLRHVWAAGTDDGPVAAFVRGSARG